MDTQVVKNTYNQSQNKSGYEDRRWFTSPVKKSAYKMTKLSLNKHFLNSDIIKTEGLELGPGPGTWTKEILIKYPEVEMDLVDISSAMLGQAKDNLSDFAGLRYFDANFLDFEPDKQYDFFFSSRAIEYLPDKDQAVKKIFDLLKTGGVGCLTTKTPKYLINRLLGRQVSDLHLGQISPWKLKKIFQEQGFTDVKVYPVTFSFPLFKSAFLNNLLFKVFHNFRLNFLSQFFSESYLIKFKKK